MNVTPPLVQVCSDAKEVYPNSRGKRKLLLNDRVSKYRTGDGTLMMKAGILQSDD
jgi:hypothetical protein